MTKCIKCGKTASEEKREEANLFDVGFDLDAELERVLPSELLLGKKVGK